MVNKSRTHSTLERKIDVEFNWFSLLNWNYLATVLSVFGLQMSLILRYIQWERTFSPLPIRINISKVKNQLTYHFVRTGHILFNLLHSVKNGFHRYSILNRYNQFDVSCILEGKDGFIRVLQNMMDPTRCYWLIKVLLYIPSEFCRSITFCWFYQVLQDPCKPSFKCKIRKYYNVKLKI